MKVIDLIIQLEKEDKNLEVVLDKTNKDGGNFFIFKGINAVEEIEVDGIGKCIMLTPFDYSEPHDQN